jgi:lipopolysaccharide assembly outer membrane protein LptD (OstA)
MNKTRRFHALLTACLMVLALEAAGQEAAWEIDSPGGRGEFIFDFNTGVALLTNGAVIRYAGAVLTADRASVNQFTGEAVAEGSVRLEREGQVWRAERLQYNFRTRSLQVESFRLGTSPVFSEGALFSGDLTNRAYSAGNAWLTTDDISKPAYRIRGRSLVVVPDKYVEARDATVLIGNVPVFFFPHYRRSLGRHPQNIEFMPGYRSSFGPFLLATFNNYWSDALSTALHFDYRVERGLAVGPEANYDLGRWGRGNFQYYYLNDLDPGRDPAGKTVDHNRDRLSFTHAATLRSNLFAKAVVRYQSDSIVIRDFFEDEFHDNRQPATFVELNQQWRNFSLNLIAQPKVNDFFETTERLPEVRLTGLRQQIGGSPLYYESESSFGYLRHESNAAPVYAAMRGDTFHQVLLPWQFFGWLNVTPRAGGRFTYYGETEGKGNTLEEETRGVFNTGMEVSLKASRVWRGLQSRFWEADGLRHILEPSVNYAFVPNPSTRPRQLPQFDTELPTLRLLPLDYPDYNAIDAIDAQNVVRFTLRNRLQTKRGGEVDNLVNWALYTDWRLNPRRGQNTFADFFSDLDFKPRSWLTLTSEVRYDLNDGFLKEANHFLTLVPGDRWSIALGHRYLEDDPMLNAGVGNNLFTSSLYYRFNENWGFRAQHRFEARDGTLEEQYYTFYRDLRAWTGALTLRVRDNRNGPTDVTVAVALSLKAFPRYRLGQDRDRPSLLLDGR